MKRPLTVGEYQKRLNTKSIEVKKHQDSRIKKHQDSRIKKLYRKIENKWRGKEKLKWKSVGEKGI
jgi:hypothetical protein